MWLGAPRWRGSASRWSGLHTSILDGRKAVHAGSQPMPTSAHVRLWLGPTRRARAGCLAPSPSPTSPPTTPPFREFTGATAHDVALLSAATARRAPNGKGRRGLGERSGQRGKAQTALGDLSAQCRRLAVQSIELRGECHLLCGLYGTTHAQQTRRFNNTAPPR